MKTGVYLTGLFREFLVMKELTRNYDHAVRMSEEFEELIKDTDWLELLDGTTFEKTFVPKNNQ